MSLHEVEDIIEESVRTLARNPHHQRNELRTLYWNLYEYQNFWDTSFTERRVLDVLIAAHHTYQFALIEHPEYQRYVTFFDGLDQFTWIAAHPTQEVGRENPAIGYADPPYLYCEVNSELWHSFVEQGTLAGQDALPVERQDLIDVARIVVEDALREENYGLIASWYYLIVPYLMFFEETEEERSRLYHHPSLLRMKQLFYQTKACTFPVSPSFLQPSQPEKLVDEDGTPMYLLIWWYQAP